jgi:hypothetical protein
MEWFVAKSRCGTCTFLFARASAIICTMIPCLFSSKLKCAKALFDNATLEVRVLNGITTDLVSKQIS